MNRNTKNADKPRLRYLDVYKGVCILFVIITHFIWDDAERLRLLFPFWVDMAVPVFMVITGYVSAMSYQTRGLDLKTSYRIKEILAK